jgi:hypothetical protein
MSLPLSNSTDVNSTGIAGIITQLTEPSNGIILGGVGVGISSLSFLIIAAQCLSKKFALGPDGKRPSISSVISGLFSTKAQETTVVNEVKGDVEQATSIKSGVAKNDATSVVPEAAVPGVSKTSAISIQIDAGNLRLYKK